MPSATSDPRNDRRFTGRSASGDQPAPVVRYREQVNARAVGRDRLDTGAVDTLLGNEIDELFLGRRVATRPTVSDRDECQVAHEDDTEDVVPAERSPARASRRRSPGYEPTIAGTTSRRPRGAPARRPRLGVLFGCGRAHSLPTVRTTITPGEEVDHERHQEQAPGPRRRARCAPAMPPHRNALLSTPRSSPPPCVRMCPLASTPG